MTLRKRAVILIGCQNQLRRTAGRAGRGIAGPQLAAVDANLHQPLAERLPLLIDQQEQFEDDEGQEQTDRTSNRSPYFLARLFGASGELADAVAAFAAQIRSGRCRSAASIVR
jgi:hypothetical protein